LLESFLVRSVGTQRKWHVGQYGDRANRQVGKSHELRHKLPGLSGSFGNVRVGHVRVLRLDHSESELFLVIREVSQKQVGIKGI
jgi:hypothetical protein